MKKKKKTKEKKKKKSKHKSKVNVIISFACSVRMMLGPLFKKSQINAPN